MYLVAIRALKIQDLIHSSSRLKEVAGGSYLLGRYCSRISSRVADHVTAHDKGKYIFYRSSGGEVVAAFEHEKHAREFLRLMKEGYRRLFGRRVISSTTPIEVGDNGSGSLNELHRDLAIARYSGFAPTAQVQNPYVAICWSCGERPADRVLTDDSGSDEPTVHHFCLSCDLRSKSFEDYKSEVEQKLKGGFTTIPSGVDDLARHDRSGYVAYMISDGNSFGHFVREIPDLDGYKGFSEDLQETIDECLFSVLDDAKFLSNNQMAPMLPLMTGGDDLLVLFPARWGISMTLDFVARFEEAAKALGKYSNSVESLSMSAGVVICKQTLSHKTVHEIGEDVIKSAKYTSKRSGLSSALAFRVLAGSKYCDRDASNTNLATGCTCGGFRRSEIEEILAMRRELDDLSSSHRRRLKQCLSSHSPMLDSERERVLKLISERNEDTALKVREMMSHKPKSIFAVLEGWEYLESHRRNS
ncbi:MAG: Cas10/Cmr2 second palm domain-containing protein [Candidatus Thorarchaeota archaeon]|nr:MAG: hypothetical protein DRP09_13440 [Candidatus Thorarchaeota archaeon]